MFYRLTTDGIEQAIPLHGFYAGPFGSTCWLVGGGPSLSRLPVELIRESTAPVFAVNLAGTGLLRPTFWTSYDPTVRFHRSIFLDPSIIKFQHRSRAMDLIPETTHKVCDAPATLFFDRTREQGFHSFLSNSVSENGRRHVIDWQDSFIQAIDIAYHLGFRKLLLAGCEMFISPDSQLQNLGKKHGVAYSPRELLSDYVQRCRSAGITQTQLEKSSLRNQYHFPEQKPLESAIRTDFHYFRVCQYLRLSRKSMSLAGLELISVTPNSRLNDHFKSQSIKESVQQIVRRVGDVNSEQTAGRYTSDASRQPANLGPMRDFKPHFWSEIGKPPSTVVDKSSKQQDPKRRLRDALEDLPEIVVNLREDP